MEPIFKQSPLDAPNPITVTAALAQGLSRSQLRSGRLRPVLRGVWVPRETADSLLLRSDAALAIYPAAVLSHDTATVLYDLPEPLLMREAPRRRPHDAALVHVTVAPPRPRPKRGGVCGHVRLLAPADVQCVAGRHVTVASRTFVDLAEFWSFPDLIALGDASCAGG